MAIKDKTTIKGYFETGDKPTEAQFIDLIDSYADTDSNVSFINIGGRAIYDTDGDSLHFEASYSTSADFSNAVSAITSDSQTNWSYFNGTQYSAFPSGGLASAYQDTVLGAVLYQIPSAIASAGIYVRVRAYDGTDWGSYTTSFGYGSVTVGRGVESSTVFSSAPASATATGTAGQISYDANYLYVCVSANVWRRSAIATW